MIKTNFILTNWFSVKFDLYQLNLMLINSITDTS